MAGGNSFSEKWGSLLVVNFHCLDHLLYNTSIYSLAHINSQRAVLPQMNPIFMQKSSIVRISLPFQDIHNAVSRIVRISSPSHAYILSRFLILAPGIRGHKSVELPPYNPNPHQ